MKKNISVLITIMIFLGMGLRAELTGEMPKETAILRLPDHSESNWKEITRYVSIKEGVIEAIPLNQTIQNWSELIGIQYMSSADWDKQDCVLEKLLERLRKEVLSSFPKGTASWQIIEKDGKGIIYEWFLSKPYKNIPIQHEVARAFLTPTGIHRVGFTRKDQFMSSEERAKWVQLLRENSSVMSFQDAGCIEGLSMVEKFQESVVLGAHFRDWRIINHYAFETGYSVVCHIPPTQVDPYITECLEVVTVPNVSLASLTDFFEIEKKCVQEKTCKKVRFHILEQSPTEIIYCYCHPRDHLQLNAVVRTFLTDHGYCSICYKKGLYGRMKEKEKMSWLEKLKTIRLLVSRSVMR